MTCGRKALFPPLTYTDPGRGAGAAPAAFCRIPWMPEPSFAVVTDRRGEGDDSAAASGLLHTLRTGRPDAPMLAPAEPRWRPLRFAAAPGLDLRDRFRGALIGGAIGDVMGRANEGVWPRATRETTRGRRTHQTCRRLPEGCWPVERSRMHSRPITAAGSHSSMRSRARASLMMRSPLGRSAPDRDGTFAANYRRIATQCGCGWSPTTRTRLPRKDAGGAIQEH